MATIAVRVGREVKEISGLTNRTTCWDVVLALLKEKKHTVGSDSANAVVEKSANGGHGTEESASNSSTSKSIKELAQSYVIVENWRGCEKPIPPRTRILNVWQAWGKEQRHVELSLKKSKHIRYREENNNAGGRLSSTGGDPIGSQDDGTATHYSLHRLSHHQKRRIRRSLMQYQRAVMMKSKDEDVDESDDLRNTTENSQHLDNRRILFEDIRRSSDSSAKPSKGDGRTVDKRNGVILSEEKFVDGVVTGPDCLIKNENRAQLISQGNFNREYCKYRRRNHRRRTSVDGEVEAHHHRRRHVSHYPYSSHHYRRRSSRHRGSRSHTRKSGAYRYSTDDTSTTTTTTTNTSEDENAEDADDEKSVLVEFACPVPRRTHNFGGGLGGCSYSSSCTTTTATDSSTTTSGDSMTSSTGCSTSSETSSGGDYALFDPSTLFPTKRVTFLPTPLENTQTLKSINNSSNNNKPKKNKSILGGLPKPALNLIESFRKNNSKRKAAKKTNSNQSVSKHDTVPNHLDNKKVSLPTKSKELSATDAIPEINGNELKHEISTPNENGVESIVDEPMEESNGEAQKNEDQQKTSVEGKDDNEALEQLAQMVMSQDIVLQNQQRRLTEADIQIEQIENDIHKLRTRALGKNYVQDTYFSGLMDSDSSSVTGLNTLLSAPSSPPVSTPWIMECDNVEYLEQYIKDCEKIVEMQLQIEQCQRKSEIILQEMQEEVWRVSTEPSPGNGNGMSPASKAAAVMFGMEDEEDASDDESGHEILSVTNCSNSKDTDYTEKVTNCENNDEKKQKSGNRTPRPMELEISRTELEASLYLSLRLTAEIEDVDHRVGTSENLIQTKGENLIKCVRDLSMSEEGVDPEIWEEYGELLTAYDIEVEQRKYLCILNAPNATVMENQPGDENWETVENAHYIDATQPNPTSHRIPDQTCLLQSTTPTSVCETTSHEAQHPNATPSSLNQALSPWMWCEHCKMEENMIRNQHPYSENVHRHHRNHQPQKLRLNPEPPKSFSDLPLPKPIESNPIPVTAGRTPSMQHSKSAITPGLLPMLPLPDGLMSFPRYNDSDYEDLPNVNDKPGAKGNKNDQCHSGEEHQATLKHGLLSGSLSNNSVECSSSNTDDSGNASAGSTSSFASSDGSRNSSCDGGSPRPIPNTTDMEQGSNSLFGRNGVLRGSWKGHFVFPSHPKQNSSQQTSSQQSQPSKSHQKPTPPPPPPASAKPTIRRPELPPKPVHQQSSLIHKQAIHDMKEHEILMQQQKLIRRNSGGRRKNFGVSQPTNAYPRNNAAGIHPTFKHSESPLPMNPSITPRGGSFKNSIVKGINGMLSRPTEKTFYGGNPSQPTRTFPQLNTRNIPQNNFPQNSVTKKSNQNLPADHQSRINSNYDNDSDTGRSSLHSADSDPIMFSETLV